MSEHITKARRSSSVDHLLQYERQRKWSGRSRPSSVLCCGGLRHRRGDLISVMKRVFDNGALWLLWAQNSTSQTYFITTLRRAAPRRAQIIDNLTPVARQCNQDKGLRWEYSGNEYDLYRRACPKINCLSCFRSNMWMDVIKSALWAQHRHVIVVKYVEETFFLLSHYSSLTGW